MRATEINVIFAAVLIIGCTNPPMSPQISAPKLAGNPGAPSHISWGQWDISIDPENGIATSAPVRNAEKHFDVTTWLNPPKCADCLQTIITEWDPATRIADLTMVLKNPTTLTGYDVKAVISDYGLKEFLLPDAWCDFYTDGTTWQPYYIFNEGGAFGPSKSYARGFQVYLPKGADTNATVTIDVSYPGPQQEPWRINNIIVSGPLQNDFYHYIGFTCHIYDHQNNMQAVNVNMAPILSSPVQLSDNALNRDYLAGDGIWGATNVKTSGTPGEYQFWIRAQSLGSDRPTYQRLDIEVIPLAPVQPPLYIVSMMHAEEWDGFLNQATYLKYSTDLRELMAIFNLHDAKIALQPDWTFITGTLNFDPTLFTDFQASGHGVDTHAHETTHDLGQVHNMLDGMGVQDTIIANGGFTKTWDDPPGGNWAAYVAHFQTSGGIQMFLAVNAYKDPTSQVIDSLFTPIRPSLTGDWMVHDPDGPLVYIAGGAIGLDSAMPNFFQNLPNAVDYAIAGSVPGKINCFYWHDSVHNYLGTAQSAARIDQWALVLGNYFDPKVKQGKLIWANFTEMYQVYLNWE